MKIEKRKKIPRFTILTYTLLHENNASKILVSKRRRKKRRCQLVRSLEEIDYANQMRKFKDQ
jgi:hypothetical protein